MSSSARLLSDLRARRLARRLIELADEIEAAHARERSTLERACEITIARLERAVVHLDRDDVLRAAIEAALRARRDAADDGFRAALAAVGEAMRRTPPALPDAPRARGT